MNISKFFRFTIADEDLNLDDVKSNVNLPCRIFKKGEIFTKSYAPEHNIVQKTNRWLYTYEQCDDVSISKFLTYNLKILAEHKNELDYYIKNYSTKMELVVYVGNHTDICLTKTQIKLLNLLNVNLYISFC